MKKILMTLLIIGSYLPAAVGLDSLKIRPQSVKTIDIDDELLKQASEGEKKVYEDWLKQGLRSFNVQTQAPNPLVRFGKVAFAQGGQETAAYLGATSANPGDFAVTRVSLGLTGNNPNLVPLGITPAPTSPDLHNQQIAHLALAGTNLAAVVNGAAGNQLRVITDPLRGTGVMDTAAAGNPNALKDAAAADITNAIAGVMGVGGDSFVVAVPQAGALFSQEHANDRGFAHVKVTPAGLAIKDADGTAGAMQAARLSDVAVLTTGAGAAGAGTHIAFRAANANLEVGATAMANIRLDGINDMHYDSKLGVGYVAFNNVRRPAADRVHEGGCLGLAKLRLQGDQVIVEPIIHNITKAALYNHAVAIAANGGRNIDDRIIGFYYDGLAQGVRPNVAHNGNEDISVTIHKVRTMHTSSGKPYLIVASTVNIGGAAGGMGLPGGMGPVGIGGGGRTVSGIFAYPLVDNTANLAQHGTIAQVIDAGTGTAGDHVTPVAAVADLPRADWTHGLSHQSILSINQIGSINPFQGSEVQDMFVVGDSVYLAVNNAHGLTGLFKVTAKINHDGLVEGWGAAQRVMGSAENVYKAALDATTGNFYFLGGPNPDTIKATHWGESQQAMHANTSLSDLVEKHFAKEKGGVYRAYDFDRYTPGFALGRFAMMVLVGGDTVMLVETGRDHADGRGFVPTEHFYDNAASAAAAAAGAPGVPPIAGAVQNVFVFTGDAAHAAAHANVIHAAALNDIAPLTCAEVLRDQVTPNRGYLFVGGMKGVARLEDGGHNGWNPAAAPLAQLTAGAFPGAGFDFVRLRGTADFLIDKEIVAIASRDGGSFVGGVATPNRVFPVILYRDGVRLINLDGTNRLVGPAIQGETFADGEFGTDLTVTSNRDNAWLIIWTTTQKVKHTIRFQAADTHTLANIEGMPLAMSVVSTRAGFNSNDSALHLLAVNRDDNKGKVYMFDVEAGAAPAANKVQQVGTHTFDLGNFRYNITADGSLLFSMQSRGVENDDALQVGELAQGFKGHSLTRLLDIDDNDYLVGRAVRNSASGAWVVPGEFGIRVNE